jgi:hypothetical protein
VPAETSQATAEPAARRDGSRGLALSTGPSLALHAALFLGAALISGFTIRRQLEPFDEGLLLQAARRVAGGQVPYSDFSWAYGPAEPYLLGTAFKAFGVSLMDWRVLRVLSDAAVALIVFATVRRQAALPVALAAWLTAACAMAQPTTANPYAPALVFCLLAVAAAGARIATGRAALLAGAAVGVAAAWRLDFALYAAAGAAAGLALRPPPRRGLRSLAPFAGSLLATGLLFHLPFLIAAGPADLYDALVGRSLRDGDYWRLPFPLDYDGRFRTWPPRDLAEDAKDVLGFYVPLILVAGLAVAVLALLLRWRQERRGPRTWAALTALAGGCLLYLLSRTDDVHATPLLVCLAALLPLAFAWARASGRRALTAAAAVPLALLLAYGVLNRASALLLPPDLHTVDVAVADGAKAPPAEARAIERMVRVVQARVPPGEGIYATTLRSDLVRINDPLIYVLTERDNVLDADFDLLTSAVAQRRIVSELRAVRPRAIVRWTDPASVEREPNRRGLPSGSRELDRHLASNFRLLERAGHYDVLVPR